MKSLLILCFIIISFRTSAQTESIRGNVASIREKIIYLDSVKQNLKIFSWDGDYGHSGLYNPENMFLQFYDLWYRGSSTQYLNYLRLYDNSGKLISEEWYNRKNELVKEYRYTYDLKERLKETKTFDENSLIYIETQFINVDGFLVSVNFYNLLRPELYETQYYLYNDQKKLIEIKYFNYDGPAIGFKYEYDSSGNKVAKICRFPKGNPDESGEFEDVYFSENFKDETVVRYFYNQQHLLIKQVAFDKGEQLNAKSFNYDLYGRLTKTTFLDSEDSLRRWVSNIYNVDSSLQSETFSGNNLSPEYTRFYFYDDGKRVTRIIEKDPSKENNILFSYEFDFKGNWIKQTKSLNGKPLYIREKIIKYFP